MDKFKSLDKALDYLYELRLNVPRLGLTRMNAFLKFMDSPEKKFQSILVAGTNGKGSVSNFLFNALKENGIKTGIYLSPHVIKFNERIQTDKGMISNKELLQEINFIHKKMTESKIPLTFFEFTTAMAISFFAKKKIKVAVLEVGLGGRLDATNVVQKPLASVITTISLDHQEFLGNSLKKIAGEKAGIIKKNSVVVIGEKNLSLQKLFEKKARKLNSKIFLAGKDFSFKPLTAGIQKQRMSYKFQNISLKPKISLIGKHQRLNASTALTTMLVLSKKLGLTEKKILSGIKKTKFIGRFQILRKNPLLIADVAHNPHGTKLLVQSVQELFPKKKFSVVFGCSSDKNCKKMLEYLVPLADEFVLSRAEYRGQNPLKLKKFLKKINSRVKISTAPHSDLIRIPKKDTLITGSIFFVGELIAHNPKFRYFRR